METLILNSGNPKDLQLLLDIAKKLGLNLTVKKGKPLRGTVEIGRKIR